MNMFNEDWSDTINFLNEESYPRTAKMLVSILLADLPEK